MKREVRTSLFLVFVAAVAVYVWSTSGALPQVAASHFNASGQANGFMPRALYRDFMVGLVLVLPLLVVFLPNAFMRRASALINLPNRDYWLAPERREQTIESLCRGSFGFGYLLVGFLGYVHWLVVRSNQSAPPRLASEWFVGGLIVFIGCVVLWAFSYLRPFFRVPRE